MKILSFFLFLTILSGSCVIDVLPPFVIIENKTLNSKVVYVYYNNLIRYAGNPNQATLVEVDTIKKMYTFEIRPNERLIVGRIFDGVNKPYFSKIHYNLRGKTQTIYMENFQKEWKFNGNYKYTIK